MVFIYDREKDMFILKELKNIKIGDIIAEVYCICYDPRIKCIKKVVNVFKRNGETKYVAINV